MNPRKMRGEERDRKIVVGEVKARYPSWKSTENARGATMKICVSKKGISVTSNNERSHKTEGRIGETSSDLSKDDSVRRTNR